MSATLSDLRDRLQTSLGDFDGIYADLYTAALNDATRETFPALHRRLDLIELVSGSSVPNGHFRDWTVSNSVPDFWGLSNATAAANTSGAHYRGGSKSMILTASAINGYAEVNSSAFPRLLDLGGYQVTARAWLRPEVANDCFLRIYAVNTTGVTQSLDSVNTATAAQWTLFGLSDQQLIGDLTFLGIRALIKTNAKTCHIDNLRLYGKELLDYVLPVDFKKGKLLKVSIQASGGADDIYPASWEVVYGWSLQDDGTNKYLHMPYHYYDDAYIRLEGIAPLETAASDTDSISVPEDKVALLVAYAKYLVFNRRIGIVSSQEVGRYEMLAERALKEYYRLLPMMRMATPSIQMKIPIY